MELHAGELTSGRDFEVYARGMDAGLALKLSDISPHVVPGMVLDKGCGTGALLRELAAGFPSSRLVGVDLSLALLERARSQPFPRPVELLEGDVCDQVLPDGAASTVVLSSVVHEVYSYSGYDLGAVRRALRSARRELRRGGHLVIRDGIRPPGRSVVLAMDDETCGLFLRFAREFRPAHPHPGVTYSLGPVVDGMRSVRLSAHAANEFLSKKDYLENWSQEVQEEFGTFTLPEWRLELMRAGFSPVVLRSYVNPWILENRYAGRTALFEDLGGPKGSCAGERLPYPDTTCVVVGRAA